MILVSINGLGYNLVINITVERTGEMIDMHMDEVLPSKSLWKASTLPQYESEGIMVVTKLSKSVDIKLYGYC